MNTLKLGIKLLPISLSGLFIISCSSKDDIYEQLTPQRLDIRTAIASTYSLDKQYFSSGDHIGVYLVDYINNQPGVLGDIANSSKNIRHTLEGSKWVADAGKEIML